MSKAFQIIEIKVPINIKNLTYFIENFWKNLNCLTYNMFYMYLIRIKYVINVIKTFHYTFNNYSDMNTHYIKFVKWRWKILLPSS